MPTATRGLPSPAQLARTNRLELTLGLPLRNREALTHLLRQLYDPHSTNYRHFLTPRQFADQFGPGKKDYQAVLDFARSNHFTIRATPANRMLVDVTALAPDVERAFAIHLRTFRHPSERRNFYAPDTDPSVERGVPILAVSGLDNYSLPRPHFKLKSPKPGAGTVSPLAGSGQGGSYFGPDFRAAYVPGFSLTGTGQTVALLEFDGYYTNDITQYEALAGFAPSVPLTNVLIDGFGGAPVNFDANIEVSLDIEMAISMAPGLARIVVYESAGTNSAAPGNTMLNQMAVDDLASQISSSWGFPINATTGQIFLQFAAQGQAFFQASGDYDAYSGAITPPSDNPNVTSVGGTTLTTSGPGGAWLSERVWNDGDGIGSGGGISTTYPIPAWQQPVNMSSNQGSTTLRNIPDVAMCGDNVMVLSGDGETNVVEGTSCAAPLWAGFMALANQQATQNSQPVIGFFNPTLYAIGESSNYTVNFHDITTGNNTNYASSNAFFAVPGYDLCSGWGTPAGTNLITDLAGPLDPLQVQPATGFVAGGAPGGPFAPTTSSLTLTSTAPGPLSWQIGFGSNWLNAAPANGVINPGDPPSVIAISLNAAASNLTAGTYTESIDVTNLDDGMVQSRPFVLIVSANPPVIVQQSSNQTVLFGGSTALSVLAIGPLPLGYQWQLNSSNLSDGATLSGSSASALTIAAAGASAGGSYTVVVTNNYGAVTSAPIALTVFVPPPQGELITFDDLTPSPFLGSAIPSPYDGLYWSNFYVLDGQEQYSTNGYLLGIVSAPNVAFNGYGDPASITANGSFNFISACLTAAWMDNLQVEAQGYSNGVLLYDTTTALSAVTPQVVTYNYMGVDEVDFRSFGGSPHPGWASGGEQFVMDNVQYYDAVPYAGPPIIINPPGSQIVPSGSPAVFSVEAYGPGPLNYQWQDNGADLTDNAEFSGTLTSSLTVTNASPAEDGSYSVAISNSYGVTNSASVSLTVFPVPPGANLITFDDLPGSVSGAPISPPYFGLTWNNILVFDGSDSLPSGYNAGVISPRNVAASTSGSGASISGPFPFILNSACLTAAWLDGLQVVAKGYLAGQLVWQTTNILSASVPTLVNFNAAAVDRVNFTATGGANHPGYSGSGEMFVMDDLVISTNNVYSGPPVIELQPVFQNAVAGQPAQFSVSAFGGGLSYQWRQNGVNLTDNSTVSGSLGSLLTLAGVSSNNLGLYSVVISNSYGSITSAGAGIEIYTSTSAPVTINFDNLNAGTSGEALPIPYAGLYWSNVWVMNATDFPGPSGVNAGLISGANVALSVNATNAFASSLNRFSLLSAYLTAAWNDNLQVEVTGYAAGVVTYDTFYTLSATAPTFVNFNYAGVDTMTFAASGGTPHPGYASNGPQFVMDNLTVSTNLSALGPPVIIKQPATLVLGPGHEIGTLSVTALGSAPLSYQWRIDLEAMPGWTNSFINITNLGDSGQVYSVVVTNAFGSVTSVNAQAFADSTGVDLNFDTLPETSTGLPVPTNYTALTWSNFDQVDALAYGVPSGFAFGATSPNHVVFNVNGAAAVVAAPSPITVYGMFATAVASDKLQLNIAAYDGATLESQYTYYLDATAPTKIESIGYGVDPEAPITELVFTATGGIPHPGFFGPPAGFIIDDINFIPSSSSRPLVWVQPLSQTQPSGGTALFQTYATGTAPLSYRWFLNNTWIGPEGESATLTLSNLLPTQAGSYYVTVSDSYGATNSATAVLTVTNPPTEVTNFSHTGSTLTLRWNVLPDFEYEVQYVTNLSQTNWALASPLVLGLSNYTVSIPSNTQRFYRVRGQVYEGIR